MKQFKIFMRSNIITCFLVYILKYRFVLPVRYYLKNCMILIRKKTGIHTQDGRKLLELKNIHKGESCILIGNGPSVRMEDLDQVAKSGMDSFGANRIVDIFDKTLWRPKYLCVMDQAFLVGVSSTMKAVQYMEEAIKNDIEKIILTDMLRKHLSQIQKQYKGLYFVNSPLALMFSDHIQPFSEDVSVSVSDMGNVTHFMVQLACYMGYKKIYLYGIDNSYTKYLDNSGVFCVNNSVKSHMDGMKKNIDDETLTKAPKNKFEAYKTGGFADKRKNDLGFSGCKTYAREHDIEIINLTHGGKLDFFKREEFEQVFFPKSAEK